MAGEVEDAGFVAVAEVEVAAGDLEFVAEGDAAGDEFAGGGEGAGLADLVDAFLDADLGDLLT